LLSSSPPPLSSLLLLLSLHDALPISSPIYRVYDKVFFLTFVRKFFFDVYAIIYKVFYAFKFRAIYINHRHLLSFLLRDSCLSLICGSNTLATVRPSMTTSKSPKRRSNELIAPVSLSSRLLTSTDQLIADDIFRCSPLGVL